jgi:translocation and assembly module TamB
MVRLLRWVLAGLLGVLLLLVLVVGGLFVGANTGAGQAFLARQITSLTGGQVRVSAISGHFPEDLHIGRIELTDPKGVWLGIDDLALAWSPRQLLHTELSVQNLSASRIDVARLPASEGSSSGGSFALPVRVSLERLNIGRIDIAEPVFGVAASLTADGKAKVPALDRAEITLALHRLDKPGEYQLDAHQDAAGFHAKLALHEQGDGLLGVVAGVTKLGPITLDAALDGPLEAVAARLVLDAGKLHANADGTIDLNRKAGELVVTLADLAPAAALAGLDLQGSTRLTIRGGLVPGGEHIEAEGPVSLTAGLDPLPVLIGKDAKLRIVADLRGSDVALTEFSLAGAQADATAQGGLKGSDVDLDWTLGLKQLQVLAPTLSGSVKASGNVAGPMNDLAARIDINGTATPPGVSGGPFTAHVDARHLPAAPEARVTATGEFAGAPLDLAINAARAADGTLHARIDRAAWRSALAHGEVSLPPGATLPLGRLDLRFDRLADLAPLLGKPVTGAITAVLDSTAQRASLNLDARNTGLTGTGSAATVKLAVEIPNPAHPIADIKVNADGVRLNAVPDPIRLVGAAKVDIPAKQAVIATLDAGWNKETLRLLSPVKVNFGDSIGIDRLRLGLRQAVLEASGRVSPTLDLTASLRGVTPDLATLFVPDLQADGSLQADARLTGPPARPAGTISVTATGLRARSGPGRGLPPAQFSAKANLADGRANLDARLSAGTAALTVNGVAPMGAGPIDLRADGTANLALLEPLISAGGRRVGGQMAVRANVRGTLQDPRIEGTMNVTNGSIQDYVTGFHLSAIAASLRGDGNTLRIDSFTARAGSDQSRISIGGSVGVLAPGMPVDLTLTARNARPVSNDIVTATLDADLALRGQASTDLAASGTVKLIRVDIRIPERLPASIPVLNVIRPGAKPPPPPTPGPNIGLGLTVTAPGQVFIRGRGLDAELGGRIRLGGTIANPIPDGHFELVRGDFTIAGQTVAFAKGEIGFDGGSLTDPSLNFLVTRSGTVTANLAITGTASSPKIALSSSPPLPQDEVLSQLLLGQSAASLQPLELAQIAAALASLTGASSGIGDPLNSVRTELGLDRLSIGNNGGGSSLDAGRYVSPGVYVGARQSLSGSGTQSVVQIDITKNLKLEGTVGTGTASATGSQSSQGTGVAVIYQKDY